jgi:hypothetical protein
VEPRAQQRFYELRAQPLRELSDWLDRYRQLWDARFQALDSLLEELEASPATTRSAKKEKPDERRKRK